MMIYSTALALGLLLASPWWLLRMATTERYREGLRQRLGGVPEPLRAIIHGRRVIWVHAVSVGEVLAASRLIAELETALGADFVIVISTTTRTGQALARERFGAARVFYMPLDFAWTIRRYLRALRPATLILMESELWPRLLHECRRTNIPTAIVNARLSDRSFARGMKFRSLWKHAIRLPRLWLAQSDEDAGRLVALGARPTAVIAAGNLKYDIRAPKQSRIAELIKLMAGSRPIVIAGSTVAVDSTNEEESVLSAWQELPQREADGVLLVLAPRHPERFTPVAALIDTFYERGSELESRLGLNGFPVEADVILLDTIGDLAAVYSIATVAFVGGSLVPRGGHNPLEPAQFGVPVIMGPSYENFRDIVGKMIAADGIRIVQDEAELKTALEYLLTQPAEAAALGARGRSVFEQQQGATARTLAALLGLL
ncbi:3-deoxy-D-manno-octulosonic acid transferase [Granulicella paludicola]|uniref:3-deoxy-D-manno-octulosonic acid transferase n=1 Tax=Granulicella paludicola TaxID=474951 RepID=UPI0021E00BF8|nr:3-deoxy-D-manno-octulosonic acid transferase [Granulicella paludicola]